VSARAVELTGRGRPEGGLDFGSDRADLGADEHQVADLLGQRVDWGDHLLEGYRGGSGDRFHGAAGFDNLSSVPGDRGLQVDADPLRTDAVRVEPNVVRTPAELLHADRADAAVLELPTEEPDLSPGHGPLRRLHILERRLHGEDRGDPKVGKESQERLGPGDQVESLHAEVLQRRQRIDRDPRVPPTDHLRAQHLFESRHRDLDRRELGRTADHQRNVRERLGRPNRGDVLERYALVTHDVRNGVEHFDLVELGLETAVVDPGLVRRFL